MPGVYASVAPSHGQVDGAPASAAVPSQDRIPMNVAGIVLVSAVVLIVLDRMKFRFAIGV